MTIVDTTNITTPPPAAPVIDKVTRVGLVLVHGIGEQKRFEHLNGEIRGLIHAWEATHDATVEIVQGDSGEYLGCQDSWAMGGQAPLKIHLRPKLQPENADGVAVRPHGERFEVSVHEVWWADVNEPYSVVKQIRYWLWGLTVWNLPEKFASNHRVAVDRMHAVVPTRRTRMITRAKILLVSNILLLTTLSFALGFALLKRVFGVEPPSEVKVFTNYLSSIKLYNQKRRAGLGFPGADADFLDTLGEPPRTSVRRRMVEALADVACAGYDQWFVLAHSLGSVVAFNGLMEPAFSFANYLDERRWAALQGCGLAGATDQADAVPPPGEKATPRRPAWIAPDCVAYRPKIFANFAGLVTYGSPIGKFGAIWPARVPVCREPAFGPGVKWLNIYDPLDPVSGETTNFDHLTGVNGALACCPTKINVGYASANVLLQAHVTYLTDFDERSLSRPLSDYFLTRTWTPPMGPRFFHAGQAQYHSRNSAAMIWWVAAYVVIVGVAAALTTPFWTWLASALPGVGQAGETIAHLLGLGGPPGPEAAKAAAPDLLSRAMAWLAAALAWLPTHWRQVVDTAVLSIVLSLVLGVASRLFRPFRPDRDTIPKHEVRKAAARGPAMSLVGDVAPAEGLQPLEPVTAPR